MRVGVEAQRVREAEYAGVIEEAHHDSKEEVKEEEAVREERLTV